MGRACDQNTLSAPTTCDRSRSGTAAADTKPSARLRDKGRPPLDRLEVRRDHHLARSPALVARTLLTLEFEDLEQVGVLIGCGENLKPPHAVLQHDTSCSGIKKTSSRNRELVSKIEELKV